MKNLKLLFLTAIVSGLISCTVSKDTKKSPTTKVGYLKDNINQQELYNPNQYKRYYYHCKNFTTLSSSYLTTYFPLSKESRLKDNFGFYFQLDGGKVEPFDHIENRTLNARGTRFEVIYRSYHAIQGSFVELIARNQSSTYYKNLNGMRIAWLECRER